MYLYKRCKMTFYWLYRQSHYKAPRHRVVDQWFNRPSTPFLMSISMQYYYQFGHRNFNPLIPDFLNLSLPSLSLNTSTCYNYEPTHLGSHSLHMCLFWFLGLNTDHFGPSINQSQWLKSESFCYVFNNGGIFVTFCFFSSSSMPF